jgi:hypothetical protein
VLYKEDKTHAQDITNEGAREFRSVSSSSGLSSVQFRQRVARDQFRVHSELKETSSQYSVSHISSYSVNKSVK